MRDLVSTLSKIIGSPYKEELIATFIGYLKIIYLLIGSLRNYKICAIDGIHLSLRIKWYLTFQSGRIKTLRT